MDRAVIDRITEGIAVLLVGPAGDEHECDASQLPEGAGDGDVITVTSEGDALVIGGIDQQLTDARRADVAERLARLRDERAGGRFG